MLSGVECLYCKDTYVAQVMAKRSSMHYTSSLVKTLYLDHLYQFSIFFIEGAVDWLNEYVDCHKFCSSTLGNIDM